MFGNGRRAVQSWKNTVSERVGGAHGGSGTTMRDGSPRVVRSGSRAHVASVNGLNHVLCVRTVIRSDHGRGFWCLFREDGRREGERMKISAFGYVP